MHAQPQPGRTGGSDPASSGSADVALLQAIASGSQPAFEELRRRYSGAVAALCRAIAGSDCEDCEQEVFARIWSRAALFDPARGSAGAWLMTLTRHTAINAQTRSPRPLPLEPQHEATVGPPDVDAFWLGAALVRLTERERTVIELAYYHELSESAIAERLQVPLGSVKSWKRRGLNRLASLLGEELA
jgi:RNA polymerase sigma-70 factor (ECF subfamily)